MNAFCASENCDAFIVFRSFPNQENAPEDSNQNWSSLKGSDHMQRFALNVPMTSSTVFVVASNPILSNPLQWDGAHM